MTVDIYMDDHISIHAPARGATVVESNGFPLQLISIHAPARGATCPQWMSQPSHVNFNSRPCERGDPYEVREITGLLLFQFTPLREGRLFLKNLHTHVKPFQFTPLREGRLF